MARRRRRHWNATEGDGQKFVPKTQRHFLWPPANGIQLQWQLWKHDGEVKEGHRRYGRDSGFSFSPAGTEEVRSHAILWPRCFFPVQKQQKTPSQ